jgi:ATP-binding cassette subfamily C (CFTR/MRP) protein 1
MLQADEQVADILIDPDMPLAVSVNASFQYEVAFKKEEAVKVSTTERLGAKLVSLKEKITSPLSTPNPSHANLTDLALNANEKSAQTPVDRPFALRDVDLNIPKGLLRGAEWKLR